MEAEALLAPLEDEAPLLVHADAVKAAEQQAAEDLYMPWQTSL